LKVPGDTWTRETQDKDATKIRKRGNPRRNEKAPVFFCLIEASKGVWGERGRK